MCIIIAAPTKTEISRWKLYNSWENNSDGAGFMYVRNNSIVVVKELNNFHRFYSKYLKHLEIANRNNSPFVLHFRIGTHGSKTIENVHPFSVNNNLAFCHNGVITIDTLKDESDTRAFNRQYLKYLPPNFIDNQAIIKLIEERIKGSKFVFLDTKKRLCILNSNLGHIDEATGVWYSNNSYCRSVERFPSRRSSYKGAWTQTEFNEEDYYRSFPEYSEHTVTKKKEIETEKIAEALKDECAFCNKTILIDDTYVETDDGPLCEKCTSDLTEMGVIQIVSTDSKAA